MWKIYLSFKQEIYFNSVSISRGEKDSSSFYSSEYYINWES